MDTAKDPIAALNNAKAKEESEAAGRDRNFTQSLDGEDRQNVLGKDRAKHRAAAGEGIRAPFAQDTGGQSQTSVFDGKGNESVVVFGENTSGVPAQGTGPDANDPGSDFGNPERG